MFGRNKKAKKNMVEGQGEKAKAKREAEQKVKEEQELLGRKSPKQVYKEEAQKTASIQAEFSTLYQEAKNQTEEKKAKLSEDLKSLRTKLDEDIEVKLKPTSDEVIALKKSTDETRVLIQELEAKLAKERKTLAADLRSLRRAEAKLSKISKPLRKEYHRNYKKIERAGEKEIKESVKYEKTTKKAMRKAVRKEKIATLKNTAKSTLSYSFGMVAAIPDVTVKLARSLVGAVKELGTTFERVAKRASTEYKKPTNFTKHRNKPHK